MPAGGQGEAGQPRSELLELLISRWGKSRVRSVVWVPGASMQVEEKHTRKEKGWNEVCVEEGPRSGSSKGLNIGPSCAESGQDRASSGGA